MENVVYSQTCLPPHLQPQLLTTNRQNVRRSLHLLPHHPRRDPILQAPRDRKDLCLPRHPAAVQRPLPRDPKDARRAPARRARRRARGAAAGREEAGAGDGRRRLQRPAEQWPHRAPGRWACACSHDSEAE